MGTYCTALSAAHSRAVTICFPLLFISSVPQKVARNGVVLEQQSLSGQGEDMRKDGKKRVGVTLHIFLRTIFKTVAQAVIGRSVTDR